MSFVQRSIISGLVVLQLLIIGAIAAPARVSAAEATFCRPALGANVVFNFPTWYKYLNHNFESGACEVSFNFRSTRDYVAVAMAIFEILLRVAGYVTLAFVMYGAFQLLTSQGEPEKFAAARSSIFNALIGLAIAIFAVAIVNLVGANVV